jgi:hypothetical protein
MFRQLAMFAAILRALIAGKTASLYSAGVQIYDFALPTGVLTAPEAEAKRRQPRQHYLPRRQALNGVIRERGSGN